AILNVLEGRPRARPFFIARMGHGAAAVVVGRMQMRGLLRGQTSSLVPRIARTTKTAAQPRMSLCSIRATDALKFKALGSGALMSGCRPMAADEHTFRRVRGQEGPSPRALGALLVASLNAQLGACRVFCDQDDVCASGSKRHCNNGFPPWQWRNSNDGETSQRVILGHETAGPS